MGGLTSLGSVLEPIAQIVHQGGGERLDHAHAVGAGQIEQRQRERLLAGVACVLLRRHRSPLDRPAGGRARPYRAASG